MGLSILVFCAQVRSPQRSKGNRQRGSYHHFRQQKLTRGSTPFLTCYTYSGLVFGEDVLLADEVFRTAARLLVENDPLVAVGKGTNVKHDAAAGGVRLRVVPVGRGDAEGTAVHPQPSFIGACSPDPHVL